MHFTFLIWIQKADLGTYIVETHTMYNFHDSTDIFLNP